MLYLLRLYAEHQGIDRFKAGLYSRRHTLPCLGWKLASQDTIGRRVISDDFLVLKLSLNAGTKLLLDQAVTKFSDKHWHKRERQSKKFNFKCYPPTLDTKSHKRIVKNAKALKLDQEGNCKEKTPEEVEQERRDALGCQSYKDLDW